MMKKERLKLSGEVEMKKVTESTDDEGNIRVTYVNKETELKEEAVGEKEGKTVKKWRDLSKRVENTSLKVLYLLGKSGDERKSNWPFFLHRITPTPRIMIYEYIVSPDAYAIV